MKVHASDRLEAGVDAVVQRELADWVPQVEVAWVAM